MSGIEIFSDRVGRGYIYEFGQILAEANDRGMTVAEVTRELIVQRGIDRYSDKITAALRRGGVDIEDGERLTEDKLRDIFAEQSGIAKDKLDSLNTETILSEIDRQASERLSDAMGFDVGSIRDAEALAANIEAGLKERVESMLEDELEKYLPEKMMARLRARATWQRSGLDPRTVQNALAQRTWRQSNKWVYA
jgi:hypothetical protein